VSDEKSSQGRSRAVRRTSLRALLWAAGATLLHGAFASTLGACSAADPSASGDLGVGAGGTAAGGTGAGASGGSLSIGGGTGGGGGSSGTGTGGSTGGSAGMEMPPPPEQELESAFEAPVATDRYVWTANPSTGRVALIGAHDLSVRLAEAGSAPTTVAALPGDEDVDAALVLNRGSDDATILRVGADGEIRSTRLTTHAGANAVEVSPQGKWAIVWTNAALFAEGALDSTDGLQDVTVVKLGEVPETTELSVGYRPSQFTFDADEEHAFAVTEPGLTVINLEGEPTPESLIALTDDVVTDQAARDVNVTPDGRRAVVRVEGERSLGVVELATGTRQSLDLGGFVTDLDLAADGSRAFAIADGELVVVPIPPGDADPSTFARASAPGEVARSVSLSPDASLALVYSNAESNPYLGILSSGGDWTEFEARAVDLKAPVRAAFASPNAQHGIAFQATAAGSTKGGAFSIVSAQIDRAPKVIGTDAAPFALAFSPDGEDAVIATRDLTKKSYGMYLVHLARLEQIFVKLSSPPLAAGIVPNANRAFVAQAHPEGRITFVDLDDGSQHTLTGFELAAEVTQ
jgi:hypothetical protein